MQRKQIKNYTASPLNYIGGKARVLDQILPCFPLNIDIFVDLFCGGCNVGINAGAPFTIYNDTSKELIGLLKAFRRMRNDTIIGRINALIDEYGFSKTRYHSFAYYGGNANLGVSAYNREKYIRLRETFNTYERHNNQYYILLYTLVLFGFNNQLRFNSSGEFNLPVGKRDFNEVIEAKFIKFFDALRMQDCTFSTKDFRVFSFDKLTTHSLVYCDPPYLITKATYNEKDGWTEKDELDLLHLLDELNERGIRFALSNVLEHEGKHNKLLLNWLNDREYRITDIFMDYHYSNYQKKIKMADSKEVLITNY